MRPPLRAILVLALAACAEPREPAAPSPATALPPSEAVPAAPPTAPRTSGTISATPATAPPASEAIPAGPAAPSPAPEAAAAPAPGKRPRPAALLGRPRAEVEVAYGPSRGLADGWTRHAGLEARYRGDRCVSLRGHVPSDMDCIDAATWLGYPSASYPLRRSDHCAWPGISERHRLARGVVGLYVPGERRWELTLRHP